MRRHFGRPDHPACLSFFKGTIKVGGMPDWERFTEHSIVWWIGVSFSRPFSFFGFMRLGGTRDIHLPPGTAERRFG